MPINIVMPQIYLMQYSLENMSYLVAMLAIPIGTKKFINGMQAFCQESLYVPHLRPFQWHI
jgi:hypothetical protein